ncbi:MAG: glycoside hydrolase family 99-like domain-containing protein [gamma proteobacterium symbiont of Bathyaustriella thionipta]|nr:glycoside hydrolase family 99-like domain-containing protein [gamma proteobacterium symbiont of Bathyaustriella thionipta]
MNTKQRKIVAVLGMHRSGTSVITRGLQVIGVELGTTLMPKKAGENDKGYWEDTDLNLFNENLLKRLDSSWEMLAPLDKLWKSTDLEAEYREAMALLVSKMKGCTVFGFKDPRTTILLPFWNIVFDRLDLDVRYLIALRNPLNVALSLQKRDAIPVQVGSLLWMKYMLCALKYTSVEKRIFLDYDRLLANPVAQLQRMQGLLYSENSSIDAKLLSRYTDDYLTTSLRHNMLSRDDLDHRSDVPRHVIAAYDCLSSMATDQTKFDVAQFQSAWRGITKSHRSMVTRLGAIDPLIALNVDIRQKYYCIREERRHLLSEVCALRETAGNAAKARDELLQERGYMEAQRDRANQQYQLSETQRSGLEDEKQALQQQYENSVTRCSDLEDEKQALQQKYENSVTRCSDLEDEKRALQQQYENSVTRCSDLEDEKRALQQQYENSVTQCSDLKNEKEVLHTQYEQAVKQCSDLETGKSSLRQEVSSLLNTQQQLSQANAELTQQIAGMNEEREILYKQRESLHQGNIELSQQKAGMEEEREILYQQRESLTLLLEKLRCSFSFQITKPLRFIKRTSSTAIAKLINMIDFIGHFIWRLTPLRLDKKIAIKNFLMGQPKKSIDYAEKGAQETSLTDTHQQNFQVIERDLDIGIEQDGECVAEMKDIEIMPVPLLKAEDYVSPQVCLIAFYLPQFHAINENDQWWGEGFTEWSNVKPATPQFSGHYQPRIPGELGYYDLADVNVMRRQSELAKLYGLSGFCFYFYWFTGTRLLERPIKQYYEEKSIETPFCLCWANENWTRRWDGLDSEVLIGQDHSAEDDLDFIRHIAKYLQDKRYIRIQGKPLLLVYRPALLPSAKETAHRWREWCRNHGIGEIYLAYTQSFETVDPKKYGFDAALEFPPNNSHLSDITDCMKPTGGGFDGKIYDWGELVARSRNYKDPAYQLFRSVCPSWDNSARRKNCGTILANSNPREYQEWLYNAITHTVDKSNEQSEQLVFVNAWNEWAEGAYLEPDERYGYAYLEASRLAQVRAFATGKTMKSEQPSNSKPLAIVIHAFYIDVLAEILAYLVDSPIAMKLYISTTREKFALVNDKLKECALQAEVIVVENRGRDILPFFQVMRKVIDDGCQYIVKVHTKKSTHRIDGDVWRKSLYDALLDKESMQTVVKYMEHNHTIGLVTPEAHIVSMDTYFGSNEKTITHLSERMGIPKPTVMELGFCAGSMFYANVFALYPLLNLAIDEDCFESESGQVDGTFAHALERAFSISAFAMGMQIMSIESLLEGKPLKIVRSGYSHCE